jgi:hypothetical protein
MGVDDADDDWEVWWDARISALKQMFGPIDDVVGHAVVPLESMKWCVGKLEQKILI